MKNLLGIPTLVLVAYAAGCASPQPVPVTPPGAADPSSPPVAVPEEGSDFVVYRGDGSGSSLADLLSDLDGVDVLLMGEEHDDVMGHRFQLEVFRRVLATVGGRGPMAGGGAAAGPADELRAVHLSLEMFERDVQIVLDEYLADLVTENHFLASARPWDNYERDYRPMVELAKHVGVPVIAANAPRRYVNRASRLGRASLADLSEEARSWLPPLPYPEASDAYRAEWDALMGDAAMHMSGSPLDAQTLWDASMGEAIALALDRAEGTAPLIVHLAGGFHVENGTGIPEALDHYRPSTSVRTVAVRAVGEPGEFAAELAGAGDFVVLTRTSPDARD